ncbi:hypothetical protein [Roseomonas marmotae]|uniref:DUF484 family protein n=1 Tax=Roseomonas marmotae TaxID=2768161 RepID=A0ABS3K7X9_9PROT|nr:hypothetical protein [Roseomonas marmotae]MBO1073570.1 hypothetical protein [Roseomonas marmotae]QTI80247.1 hypothetical protein IAI58_05690 [Roseomonas marmotae]
MTDGADRVAAWLRANPSFLAERPELYRLLAPPHRIHGEGLADHMAAMIAAERAANRELAATARAEDGFVHRAQRAVVALIAAPDAAEAVAQEWPALLGLEHCTLAGEGTHAPHRVHLPPGTVEALLPSGRDTLLRDNPADPALLHGEAAALITRDALARLPLPGPPVMLVLGARREAALPRSGAAPQLRFLAAALVAALGRP